MERVTEGIDGAGAGCTGGTAAAFSSTSNGKVVVAEFPASSYALTSAVWDPVVQGPASRGSEPMDSKDPPSTLTSYRAIQERASDPIQLSGASG